jgi:hypothetical protein
MVGSRSFRPRREKEIMFPTRTEEHPEVFAKVACAHQILTVIYLEYYELRKPENVARLEWLDQRCQEARVLCLPRSFRPRREKEIMFPTRTEEHPEVFAKVACAHHLEYYELRKPENVARLEWLDQRCQEARVLCFPHSSKADP